MFSSFLPGTPFDPTFFTSNGSNAIANKFGWTLPVTTLSPVTSSANLFDNTTSILTGSETEMKPESPVMMSLIVFSVALTLGRFGFWIIDLAGSQLLLENIKDEERGTVCAVHYSLKKLMNRVKYVLAMFLSWPQTFGFLIIASQCFSLIAYAFFIVYCRKSSAKVFKIYSPQ